MFFRRFLPALFLVLLITSGCASFPGKELPRYTYEQIPVAEPKHSIDYDLRFLTFGADNATAVKIFQEEIEKVFNESKIFEKSSPTVGTSVYHFSMVLRNEGNVGLAFLSGFISGMTFTVLPAYGKDNYILTVDVKKDGEIIKSYQYNHYIETWVHLSMIVLTSTRHPDKIVREAMDDMVKNFLHDLQKDKLLQSQISKNTLTEPVQSLQA